MVKDEDVCLHCGLCAERCPTGAWDMQKYLIDMTGRPRLRDHHVRPKPDQQRKRLRRPLRQRQRFGVSQRQRDVRPIDPAPRRAGVAAQRIFPSNIQGLPTWYEVRVTEDELSRRPRRRRHDGGDEPADLGQATSPRSSPAAICSMIRPSRCRHRNSGDDITRDRRAADRDHQLDLHRSAPAPALQEHHLSSARSAPCSTWIPSWSSN